ncbi:prolyl oligopeptidase family serine peptidase [Chromatiaceae bacterium AAb-1]|nr:prolyl oligopeptidase family serine peptidase [Chromatiaceae bacterium AAb-1]
MKYVLCVVLLCSQFFFQVHAAQQTEASKVLYLGPLPHLQSQTLKQSGKADEIRSSLLAQLEQQYLPVAGQKVSLFGNTLQWRTLTPAEAAQAGPGVWFTQLQHNSWWQGELNVSGLGDSVAYINYRKLPAVTAQKISFSAGYQQLVIFSDGLKTTDTDIASVKLQLTSDSNVRFELSQQETLNNRLLTNAETISQLALSADGSVALLSFSGRSDAADKAIERTELRDIASNSIIQSWAGQVLRQPQFSPDGRYLSFIADNSIQLLNLHNWQSSAILRNQKDIGAYRWLPDSQSLIFSWNTPDNSKDARAKRYREMEDRWRGFRDTSRLYQLDIQSGLIRPLTTDAQSSYLADIRADGKRVLLTQRRYTREEAPHSSTAVLELDLATLALHEIGEFRFLNQVQYYQNQLLVVAGPSFADNAGVNLQAEVIPNDYDGQLYLMSLDGKTVKALSKEFKPAISSAATSRHGDILLQVTEQDRNVLYFYDLKKARFTKTAHELDVVEKVVMADNRNATVLAIGSSVSAPQQLVQADSGSRKGRVLYNTAAQYQHIRLGEVKDYTFTNSNGELIEGRYYLPPDFDASKEYPLIVYYYGGTTPVSRAFTGRYPFHHWAANDYVVYVLQPRGTIGYGQDFSALHVNAWGDYTADDIIEGTRSFVKAHPFINDKKIGNAGASYGGFMTMYLATKTDLFAASISHAGISSLSSYWGQGWWGFSYSGLASRGSFPWNNKELYVEHSPLFNADKVTTPLLLITGDSDVNVPAGESHQMYTALKLLGKDVALVEIPGEDHHILDREKRYVWWDHLLAWFDRHLKDQPQWWDDLNK